MGRGPRRQRFRFRDEPDGARIRAFLRQEETTPYNARDEHGHPIRTRDNRRAWQAEADRLADWFLDLHPAAQRKITVFVVRCPRKGCLLGQVFRRGLSDGGARYVWLGATWTGRGAAGIVNWAWDGYRGSKGFMIASCDHGFGNVEFGLLEGMVEALEYPRQAPPDEWLHHYDPPIRRGYARRTLILPDTNWRERP
jgi:hypothetical protein